MEAYAENKRSDKGAPKTLNSLIVDGDDSVIYDPEDPYSAQFATHNDFTKTFPNNSTPGYIESLRQLRENSVTPSSNFTGLHFETNTDISDPTTYANQSETERFVAALVIQRSLRRFRDRKIFCDIANTLLSLCTMTTPALLCALNKKLYDHIDFRLHDVKIFLRLKGPCFPPVPIYRVYVTTKSPSSNIGYNNKNLYALQSGTSHQYPSFSNGKNIGRASPWMEVFPSSASRENSYHCAEQIFAPAFLVRSAQKMTQSTEAAVAQPLKSFAKRLGFPIPGVRERSDTEDITLKKSKVDTRCKKTESNINFNTEAEKAEMLKKIKERAEQMKKVFGLDKKSAEVKSPQADKITSTMSKTLKFRQYPIDGIEEQHIFEPARAFESTTIFSEVDQDGLSFGDQDLSISLSSSKRRIWDVL